MKLGKKSKIALSLLSASLFLVACGSKEKETKKEAVELGKVGEFPITKDKLKMTMMGPRMTEVEWADLPVFKDYAEKTNMEFKFITPPSDDFGTKLNLAFASGDLPDVLFGTGPDTLTPAMEMDYGEQGLLVPLEDLIDENMPNFKKLMDEDPTIKKSITTPDGHIYSLPWLARARTASWPKGPMWYRGDWLDAVGQKELPQTTDEFYDLLVKYRDEDPNGNGKKDEIPLTDTKMEHTSTYLMGAFGMKARGIQEIDGKVEYTPVTDNYKEYVTFMNKLYSEKLLDQEVYSQSGEQKTAKGQNNQLGVFQDWYSFFTTGKSPEEAVKDPMFQPLTSPVSEKAVIPGSPRMQRATFAITNKAASPEALLRWVDYFYSEEGAFYLNKGPEGEFWKWETNDKGEKVRVVAKDSDKDNPEEGRKYISPAYGMPVPTVDYDPQGEYIIYKNANEPLDTTFDDFIAKETKDKIDPAAEVPFPLLYLTKEETDKTRDIGTDMKTYVEQMEAKFITGVEPISNWDKYVKTLEGMGVEEYVKVYQGAYDRWAETK
ncbi:MAG: extracellular solute-binding protein [Vagococcus sp.]|uniref:extracellular solute-binding protein n=1 Tax=Vagococcus TaxID=2737 RepID=UPI002FC9653B